MPQSILIVAPDALIFDAGLVAAVAARKYDQVLVVSGTPDTRQAAQLLRDRFAAQGVTARLYKKTHQHVLDSLTGAGATVELLCGRAPAVFLAAVPSWQSYRFAGVPLRLLCWHLGEQSNTKQLDYIDEIGPRPRALDFAELARKVGLASQVPPPEPLRAACRVVGAKQPAAALFVEGAAAKWLERRVFGGRAVYCGSDELSLLLTAGAVTPEELCAEAKARLLNNTRTRLTLFNCRMMLADIADFEKNRAATKP